VRRCREGPILIEGAKDFSRVRPALGSNSPHADPPIMFPEEICALYWEARDPIVLCGTVFCRRKKLRVPGAKKESSRTRSTLLLRPRNGSLRKIRRRLRRNWRNRRLRVTCDDAKQDPREVGKKKKKKGRRLAE